MTDARDLQVITDPIKVFPCSSCGVKLDLSGRVAFSTARCPACRAEMPVPARLGGFVLLEVLGSGGMGSAYRARDELLNRDVAIKVMRKSFGDDPKFVATFRREAQTAAKLNHPNVVQIHSFGEFKGQPYIVMELVTGGSLDRLIAAGEPLDQAMVMQIGMEIASALQSGYKLKLIHGDIKPENILLDEKGTSKLVDFGIAQLTGGGGDSKEVWGTPYYVAPEKVRRQRTDCRSDIYCLGGTLYHALTGKPPFDGSDATAVVKERFLRPATPLREVRADIDPEIERIVARMLQVEPLMRYPTYESLLGDMRRFLDRVGPLIVASKKIMLLRKKGAGSMSPSVTAKVAPTTGGVPRMTGKLFIKQDTTTGLNTVTSALANVSATPATGSYAPVSAPATRRVSSSVVALLVLLGVLLLGGAVAGIRCMSKQEGVEETPPVANQNNEAQIAQAAAIQRIDACLAQAQTTGSNLLAWAETAGQLCASANKSVTDVLGADAHDSMIPPRPSASANPAEPAQEDTSKEPVLAQVRNMYRAWYRMDEIAVEATALREEVAAASAAARATPSETLNQQATAFGGRIQALATGAKADESRGKLASIRADLTTVSNMVLVIRKRLIREAGQARQQAELEKQKQEAEKREAARQTKIGSEIAEITAKEAEIKGLLHKQNYHDARWQLRTVYSPLMEEESRKAYAVATQRVARIEELRDFIVAHVSGYQHPDGWTIESADKNSLVVRNKMGTNVVAWADVGDVRIVLFIRHLLMDEEMSRNLKLREHVRMLVAAALYCRKVVPENKNAQDLADKMLEKAVSLLPDAKDDIALLLPAGPKTDSDKPTGDKPADETAAK